jgi:hypothetical protein
MANSIMVKLRPNFGLAAAASKVNLRPLYEGRRDLNAFGVSDAPAWYMADLPDTTGPNAWDLAHARVADQLGVDASAVLFAEPDLDQAFDERTENVQAAAPALGMALQAADLAQSNRNGKVVGPSPGWHLEDDFSQLKSARNSVEFSDPRTRIAHLDTGYDPNHPARPEDSRIILEHSFVDGDPDPNKAQSGSTLNLLPQNLDHGTGTLGILAGRQVPLLNNYLGGAPFADIVELRIGNSVVLIEGGSFIRKLQFKTSAFVQALRFAMDNRCNVVSMSLGGLPSKAWSETVNAAYEAGICICAAAGNYYDLHNLQPHYVVYPARYRRVLAVCGVMADHTPYFKISRPDFQGSWGPDSCMTEAIASYTPNIPWPIYKTDQIRENGEGTSAATPQVAAAVALWYEKYKQVQLSGWQRVEAARNALFQTAKAAINDPGGQHCGHGILQANNALAVNPSQSLPSQPTPPDDDSFAFLRVITGLGLTEKPPRELMFNLELTQLYEQSSELQQLIPDPAAPVDDKTRRDFMDAVIENKQASIALKQQIASRYPVVNGGKAPLIPSPVPVPEVRPIAAKEIKVADPPFRRIRCYAVDPSFSTRLETVGLNDVVLKVKWEPLSCAEGEFVGEYLRIKDVDVSGTEHALVDLNDPRLLAQDGWPPSEGNPQFHQQMIYAVAMKTIQHFERALGRRVLWRPEREGKPEYVGQLTIKPHALEEANAYYSPQEVALKFGYFEASADDPGDHVPGSRVYACLSHDIIAHETTHAILDGMHKQFNQATNPDVLAFHEAFADIVALMQHFTIPEILENVIIRTRGNLESESILAQLAVQFGRAVGGRGALRDAIGKVNKDGSWTRRDPDPSDYANTLEPHARGALLVASVFDAFLAIYKTRTADLLRIYTGGTGVLPAGAIHPDLVHRLAAEAAKSAGHVLSICIRAVDYIPPVDVTFGEFLRGLITADADLVEDDRYNYRVAFIESFRKRGIYPLDLDTLSVDTLRWQGVSLFEAFKDDKDTTISELLETNLSALLEELKKYANSCSYIPTRKDLYHASTKQLSDLKDQLPKILAALHARSKEAKTEFANLIGIDPELDFELSELRRLMRIGPDGQRLPQIVFALTQKRELQIEGATDPQFFYGGATLIVDLASGKIQYSIGKRVNSKSMIKGETREQRTMKFLQGVASDPLQRLLLAPEGEPFAAMHSLGDIVS